jgi:hypothetical protein
MIIDAIYNVYPATVTVRNGEAFDSDDNLIATDQAVIDTEVTRLQVVHDGLAYARTRKAKYDLLNQDEMRYDDTKNSTTTWIDAIDAIKVAHPKP